MDITNSAVKAALDNLLTIHKNAKSESEFMESGFSIIQTLLNNIHMAQSHMFASLINGISKRNIMSNNKDFDSSVFTAHDNTSETEINAYMSQFSNISSKDKYTIPETVPPYYDNFNDMSRINKQTFNKKSVGPIDKWLREKDSISCSSSISKYKSPEIDEFERDYYQYRDSCYPISRTISPFDEEPYHPVAWHEKVNVDVEQCCARIGNQLFMIDNMDSEFLDNYPPDTYIDDSGFVHGRSCLRTIDVSLFNSGQIFCNDHLIGYDDIRKPPTALACPSPEYDFM